MHAGRSASRSPVPSVLQARSPGCPAGPQRLLTNGALSGPGLHLAFLILCRRQRSKNIFNQGPRPGARNKQTANQQRQRAQRGPNSSGLGRCQDPGPPAPRPVTPSHLETQPENPGAPVYSAVHSFWNMNNGGGGQRAVRRWGCKGSGENGAGKRLPTLPRAGDKAMGGAKVPRSLTGGTGTSQQRGRSTSAAHASPGDTEKDSLPVSHPTPSDHDRAFGLVETGSHVPVPSDTFPPRFS